ncbi:hypothetical protein KOR42_32870 [Thalassoglobus neptunius]|uniref:DUF669 domain-containing protein n=1 Tax=Thalassoglobus neptunius TaxID=1938619 RepID=A0A5C5WLY6_9PLAN|nr:DUF669 domain-containing protein [Thalassoglobus neptunius]TWT51814.1 hypothetical protein KOR42_32870 [Thalassoglobus neptunius]
MQIDYDSLPEGSIGFDPLPVGDYPFLISGVEDKNNNQGRPYGVKFEFTIEGSKYAGRKLFEFLNLGHDNPAARDLAGKILRAIVHAIGKSRIANTQELIGGRGVVKVGQKRNKEGELENVIRDYSPSKNPYANGSGFTAPPQAPPQQAPPPQQQPPQQYQAPPAQQYQQGPPESSTF